jgi:carboxylesterase
MKTLPFTPFTGPEHQPFHLPGERGAALLTHGFPGSPLEMRATGELLSELGFSARGILLPGFGREIETLPTLKMEDWLRAVTDARALLQTERAPRILVGNSMGAALTLKVASASPPDALILFAPFWKLPGILWASLPLIKRILPEVRPFRIMKPNFDSPQFRQSVRNFSADIDVDDPAVRAAMIDFAIPIGMFDEIRRTGLEGHAVLEQITCPTLIIQGRSDPLVRPEVTRGWLAKIPAPVTYVEVDAEHDSYDAQRASWIDVRAEITEFVKRILEADSGFVSGLDRGLTNGNGHPHLTPRT